MTDALVLDRISKSFGRFRAVDAFSLRVPAGQVLGFLGPNGAGKTTTIRMVMGITHPDSGRIEILGHPVATEIKDRIGYLPEERGLYRKLTVNDTLRYFGRLKGLQGQELRRRIEAGLSRVNLLDRARSRVETLSKGMQQKLQFICTLLHDPELVILDEPFSGLDPLNVELLEGLIHELRTDGKTVIFSTHQMEQAERLCDQIVLINRGRKLVEGTLAEIRAPFDARIVVLEGVGDFAALARLPGVADARYTSGSARLELQDGTNVETLLHQAVSAVRLQRFELQRPSLQQIFVRLVGADEAPPPAAAGGAPAPEVRHA